LTAPNNNIEIEIHSIVKQIILFSMPITFVETRDSDKISHADVFNNWLIIPDKNCFKFLFFKASLE